MHRDMLFELHVEKISNGKLSIIVSNSVLWVDEVFKLVKRIDGVSM